MTENVICAIIANALFGGELRLVQSQDAKFPRSEYVFEVSTPASGDWAGVDFERAVYLAIFPNHRENPEIQLESGPLTDTQRQLLLAKLDDIKQVDKGTLALVVPAGTITDAAIPSSSCTQILRFLCLKAINFRKPATGGAKPKLTH